MHKILITDSLSEKGIKTLKAHFDVSILKDSEKLSQVIGDYHGLIIKGRTQVTRSLIELGRKLKIIGRAGVGVDNIDLEAASEQGIHVVNSAFGGTISTVEHTIGLILCLTKRIRYLHQSILAGKWERDQYGMQLYGKVLGIIGLGKVGKEVGLRLKGFGMKVLGNDLYLQNKIEGIELVRLEEIYQQADIITVHVPLTQKTKHLITAKEIAIMKDKVFLINCARGGVMKEMDVKHGLETGKIAGAAFDTFETEPIQKDNLLIKQAHFLGTPHMGARTKEAQESISQEVAEAMIDFFTQDKVNNG